MPADEVKSRVVLFNPRPRLVIDKDRRVLRDDVWSKIEWRAVMQAISELSRENKGAPVLIIDSIPQPPPPGLIEIAPPILRGNRAQRREQAAINRKSRRK